MPRWGAKMARHSIVKGLRDALASTEGVAAQQPGAVERLELLMEDWRDLRRKLGGTGNRMLAVLDEPGLAELAASIDAMSALSAGVIVAGSGDPRRFASGRAVVKHAGLNPSEHASATMNGQMRISRRGRPGKAPATTSATMTSDNIAITSADLTSFQLRWCFRVSRPGMVRLIFSG
jgi:hypothetical protein